MTSPAYPGALDALANPGPTTETDDAGYELDIVVARLQNCVMAIEGKLGIGAGGPPATAAVLRRSATGTSVWGQLVAGDVTPGAITATQLATAAATAVTAGAPSASSPQNTTASIVLLDGCQLSYGNGTGATTTGLLIFNASMYFDTAGLAGYLDLFVNNGLVQRRQINNKLVNCAETVTVVTQVSIPSAAVLFEARFGLVAASGGAFVAMGTLRSFVLIDFKR